MLLGFVKINDISKQYWGKQMNVLDKITQFRLERNWTEYQLSVKSGLTQSTISSWYRKDMLPSITSLGKLCDAFGITMSQFFMDEETGSGRKNLNNIEHIKNQNLLIFIFIRTIEKSELFCRQSLISTCLSCKSSDFIF